MTDEGWNSGEAREAFSLLGHDIRLDIVLALLDEWVAAYTEPRSYTELMDAVGVQDSGKFNYHLEQLRGVYVEKTEGGYVPTASATALYRAVLAYRPTEPSTETVDLEETCPECGSPLTGAYERSFLTVECPGCDDHGRSYPFPQNGVRNRSGTELARAVEERALYEIGLARTGQCPECAGEMRIELHDGALGGTLDSAETHVELTCDTCSMVLVVEPLTAVALDPQVGATLLELGVESPRRGREDGDLDVSNRVASTDPIRLHVDLETDDGAATIVLGDDLAVRAVER